MFTKIDLAGGAISIGMIASAARSKNSARLARAIGVLSDVRGIERRVKVAIGETEEWDYDLYAQKDKQGEVEVIVKRKGLPEPLASEWPSAHGGA